MILIVKGGAVCGSGDFGFLIIGAPFWWSRSWLRFLSGWLPQNKGKGIFSKDHGAFFRSRSSTFWDRGWHFYDPGDFFIYRRCLFTSIFISIVTSFHFRRAHFHFFSGRVSIFGHPLSIKNLKTAPLLYQKSTFKTPNSHTHYLINYIPNSVRKYKYINI